MSPKFALVIIIILVLGIVGILAFNNYAESGDISVAVTADNASYEEMSAILVLDLHVHLKSSIDESIQITYLKINVKGAGAYGGIPFASVTLVNPPLFISPQGETVYDMERVILHGVDMVRDRAVKVFVDLGYRIETEIEEEDMSVERLVDLSDFIRGWVEIDKQNTVVIP